MTLWIGCDPGGKTGIVAVQLGTPEILRHHETIIRPPSMDFVEWARHIRQHVLQLRRDLYAADIARFAGSDGPAAQPAMIAVEYLVPNVYHMRRGPDGETRRINPDGLVGAALQAGYLLGWGEARGQVVVGVRPGRHGKHQPLRSLYPAELVGPRVTTGTGDKHEHERAALDIARAGPAALRMRQAVA